MTDTARHGSPPGGWDGDHAGHVAVDDDGSPDVHQIGIDPAGLADEDLLRELGSLHRTRLHTLRHGPDAALATHLKRTAELETEYLSRHPGREVDPSRLTQDL
jgi:hypothetical protein